MYAARSRSGVKRATLLYFAFLHPLDVGLSQSCQLFSRHLSWHQSEDFLFYLPGGSGKAYAIENIKAAFKVTGIFP